MGVSVPIISLIVLAIAAVTHDAFQSGKYSVTMNDVRKLYRVVICNNLVTAIETLAYSDDVEVPQSALETSSLLAKNNRRNGSLDGTYYFDDSDIARHFALLSLDFIKCIVEQSQEALTSAHISESGWKNPHCKAESET